MIIYIIIHNPLKYTKSMYLCVQLDQWEHIILLLIFCHLHTFTIIDAHVKHGTRSKIVMFGLLVVCLFGWLIGWLLTLKGGDIPNMVISCSNCEHKVPPIYCSHLLFARGSQSENSWLKSEKGVKIVCFQTEDELNCE